MTQVSCSVCDVDFFDITGLFVRPRMCADSIVNMTGG